MVMLGSIALAFVAAISWGASDFLGGATTRGTPVSLVLALSQSCGLVICLLALLCAGASMPAGWPLVESALAGLAAVVALGFLYMALTFGKSILAAPLAASGAVIPVATGIAQGDPVDATAAIAIVVMLAGVIGVSASPGARESSAAGTKPRSLIITFSVGAATATGIYLTFIGQASTAADPLGVITAVKLSAAVTAIVAQLVRRRVRLRRDANAAPAAPTGIAAVAILAVGVTDAAAEILYAYASHAGDLAIASVVANLYPAFTVLLSVAILRERIRPWQAAAAAAALIGVLLLASQY